MDGKCQFSEHQDLDDDSFTNALTDDRLMLGVQGSDDLDLCNETLVAAEEDAAAGKYNANGI